MNDVSSALSRVLRSRKYWAYPLAGQNLSFRRIVAVSNVDEIAEYGRDLVVS